ncbi:MAG: hypothetical protein IIZ63_03065 [Caulobacteraceae bacterium]|nr:hypothetical protein [Caulobacteraceae bacterium]
MKPDGPNLRAPSLGLTALLLAAAPATGAEPGANSRTLITMQGRQQPAWFLCDGIDAPTVQVVGKPDAKGDLVIAAYDKAAPGPPLIHDHHLGPADPGAGNVHYALTRNGRPAGFLHAFNPGMLDDPDRALTPPFTSMRVDGREIGCRWLEGTRLIGFSARRTFAVTQDRAGRLTYRTFDFSEAAHAAPAAADGVERTTRPTLTIDGGVESAAAGQTVFRFTNNGYGYVVRVPISPGSGPAKVLVTRGGRTVQTEPLAAYTWAPRPSRP